MCEFFLLKDLEQEKYDKVHLYASRWQKKSDDEFKARHRGETSKYFVELGN